MKYFFDNCISPKYVKMLAALDVDVVALREYFPPNIQDVELFTRLQGSDRVFVTADTSQATRKHEAAALLETGVTALFLGPFWGKMILWQQATWLITNWPKLDGFARGATKGICADVQRNGRARPFRL